MNSVLAALEFNIRSVLNKVINLRDEKIELKKDSFNYKKMSLLIEEIDNILTDARAPKRTSIMNYYKKLKGRNYAA